MSIKEPCYGCGVDLPDGEHYCDACMEHDLAMLEFADSEPDKDGNVEDLQWNRE